MWWLLYIYELNYVLMVEKFFTEVINNLELTENFDFPQNPLRIDCSVKCSLNLFYRDFFFIQFIVSRPDYTVSSRSDHVSNLVAVIDYNLKTLDYKALLAFKVGSCREALNLSEMT